jgi:electron transport complex protein RnfG
MMRKREDTFCNMIVVLAVICAVAGLTLGATYRVTRDRIAAEQERGRMDALRVVLPEAGQDGFREVRVEKSAFAADGRYYEAYDKPPDDASRKLVGYALEAAGTGYSSTIRVTVGIDPKAETIRGIKITFQQETPGLGANCEAVKAEGTLWDVLFGKRKEAGPSRPWFQAQFSDKRADRLVKIGNKYEEIDGLTGATITTNAVTDAVIAAVKEFRETVLKSSSANQ